LSGVKVSVKVCGVVGIDIPLTSKFVKFLESYEKAALDGEGLRWEK